MISTLVAALALAHPLPTPTALIAQAEAKSGLKLDDLFPRKPFFGRGATSPTWSKDGRYLAYAWLPYGAKGGSDLYLYDTQTKRSTRLTSPENMARFDRDITAAEARYKKETEEEDKSLGLDDAAYREWRQKRKEENEKRKEPLPAYGGVGEIDWSPQVNGKGGDEILFTFDGDVFRTGLDGKPTRLTRTAESESSVRWLPNADGYTYERTGGVYRTMFGTGAVEQLNPKLPSGVSYSGYRLSPDGTKLMVTGFKPGPASRLVDYISYRDRFATVQKTARDVADDEFKGEAYVYLYDLSQDSLDDLKGDGKPWEVWSWKGGKEYQQISTNDDPWSPDSKRFVFGTWRRSAKEQTIVVADVATKTTKTIYTAKPDGEMNTPGMANPFFTKDGKGVIALLDASGYRQAWLLNPDQSGARPLTVGNYELYPLQQTADGKSLIVAAEREDPARYDLYRVDMATGAMTRLTKKPGRYNAPVISEDGKRFAANFASWSSPSALVVGVDGTETALYDPQRPDRGFDKLNTLKPQRFTFKNRHGQDIQGFMFLPPDLKKTDKRPVMIYVYGGPLGTDKSVEEGAFNSTAYLFNMYLAKTFGYIAVTIDPRGQSGYGNDFGKANYQQPGKAQVEDLTDGVKWLQENYNIDRDKVAVNGWSFGGFQTQMCLYTAPDVFTLGIAGAGPTEWQNYNNWYSTGTIGPVPNGKPEDLDPYSLTNLAKNLRSPLLLLHGMEDTNVLFQDTVKVYRKLLQAGKGDLVELALDPTGNHGMGGDMDTRDRHAIYATFLAKWWGPYERK
jgi:dipeptidyl aminopeptidase/acylaminoacyl peptidase